MATSPMPNDGDPIQYMTANGWLTGTFHGSIDIGGSVFIRIKRDPKSLYFYVREDQVRSTALAFDANNPNKTFKLQKGK